MPLTLEMLRRLLGPFPDAAPLDPRVVESVDCGSYVREKVTYTVEPSERVSAFILVPKTLSTPAPAVFCHHQHASRFDIGKSEVVGLAGDADQAYASELAERGYVAFAPDAIAFEERNWSPGSGRAEYAEMTNRLVQGKTLLAKALHDVTAGIDYLASRPEVDAGRIGFLGHSYGGRMALWAPVFDRRIRASVSHCGCIGYRESLARDAGIQPEFCLPGILEHGDLADIVALAPPAAILISATDDDVWSRGARNLYEAAVPSFGSGCLELKTWGGPHVFRAEMREYAYAFLDRHLQPPVAATVR